MKTRTLCEIGTSLIYLLEKKRTLEDLRKK